MTEALMARILGEYYEMPGLRLTVSEASRLWQLDRATCAAILDRLVVDERLRRTRNGAYVSVSESMRRHRRSRR